MIETMTQQHDSDVTHITNNAEAGVSSSDARAWAQDEADPSAQVKILKRIPGGSLVSKKRAAE